MEIFFETLLVLVCVGVLAFAGLTEREEAVPGPALTPTEELLTP